MKSHISIFKLFLFSALLSGVSSCDNRKFTVSGEITGAKDSVLYLEHVSLDGPVATDSVPLDGKGAFSFSEKSPVSPEFYRLRIAGQIINIAIDSTETVTVKANYPTMSVGYEVKGSEDCSKIKELALQQMVMQQQINAIAKNPNLGVKAVEDSVQKVVDAYKEKVKWGYIFKEPMKAYAYYALFQTYRLGALQSLIFNPRSNKDDMKVFAAVATSWDAAYPDAERGKNLHNIAIEGMKDIKIMEAAQNRQFDARIVDTSGIIDAILTDNKGQTKRLSDLKGHVVLLDFHLFAGEGSTERIMRLRELYNKYHDRGLEIYQVSVDDNEHFWKTQTAALPWTSVRVATDDDASVLRRYNVSEIPTFFLLDKNCIAQKRDVQISDIDAAIQALL